MILKLLDQSLRLVSNLALKASMFDDTERKHRLLFVMHRAMRRYERREGAQASLIQLAVEISNAAWRGENLAEYTTIELQRVLPSVRHMAGVESRNGNDLAFHRYNNAANVIKKMLELRGCSSTRLAYRTRYGHYPKSR